MINAEVVRNDGESDLSVIRRFSKRVQGTGLTQNVKSRRYCSRIKSRNVRKKHSLQVIGKRNEIKELIDLGKMQPQTSGAKRTIRR